MSHLFLYDSFVTHLVPIQSGITIPKKLGFIITRSISKLTHASCPPNPLLAEPMYLVGIIERIGTGIPGMIKACLDAGLKEPDLPSLAQVNALFFKKVSYMQISSIIL
ncbi:MAG: ATP-binding protein [Caldisericia bacterium]|nr:ATP-binding protein [Caldisericia bacterium]